MGIDVIYIGAEVMVRQTEESTLIDGIPPLVVEVLSPSDTIEDINEKIDAYLAARVTPSSGSSTPIGVPSQCISPICEPKLFNVRDELSAEPHLPGFRVPVCSTVRVKDQASSRQCSMTLSLCVHPGKRQIPDPSLTDVAGGMATEQES